MGDLQQEHLCRVYQSSFGFSHFRIILYVEISNGFWNLIVSRFWSKSMEHSIQNKVEELEESISCSFDLSSVFNILSSNFTIRCIFVGLLKLISSYYLFWSIESFYSSK